MLSAPDFEQKKVIVALLSHGEKLSFKNDNIIIKDESGFVRHQSSCYLLFSLFIVGHLSVTSGLLQRAKRFGFSIFLLSHGLKPYGSWLSSAKGNTILRQKQYQYHQLDIAQYLVKQKIIAQLNSIKKRRHKSAQINSTIASLQSYQSRLPDKSLDMQAILGIEGIASKLYFQVMFDNINWQGRQPRVKHDIANLLLDIGYTQLFNLVDAMLNLYGFDTYKGVYHQAFYQRKSLVCDLVEPFRPLVDMQVRNAFQLNQINEQDFDFINQQYRIFGNKAKPYISLLMKNLLDNKIVIFYFIQQYYRAFMQDKLIEEFPDLEYWQSYMNNRKQE